LRARADGRRAGGLEDRGRVGPAKEGGMATCPECDAEIEVDEYDVDKGDLLSCPECGSALEITGVSPIELDLAAEEEDAEPGDDGSDDLGDDNEDEDAEKEDWEE
jgi:alpha-aminoadipate carrier protein LysW